MYKYIGIEDLVSNALIEIMSNDASCRKVSLKALSAYGAVVVKLLSTGGNHAILLLTRDSTYGYIKDYSDYYHIDTIDGEEYIVADVDMQALRAIRGNFTVDLAEALTREESLQILFT